MVDVNEVIVKNWLQLCKNQFTLENISYVVPHNYSDIDILAVDKNGVYYNYEIKWRSVYSIGATDKETVQAYIKQLTRPERMEKIKQIIGHTTVKNIFVTTKVHFGKSETKRKGIEEQFNVAGISILYFSDILNELVSKISTSGRYDSEVLQTIRMLKFYNLLKEV